MAQHIFLGLLCVGAILRVRSESRRAVQASYILATSPSSLVALVTSILGLAI
jgi:hypothetical protein